MTRQPIVVRTARILVAVVAAVAVMALAVPPQAHADDTVGVAIAPATKNVRDSRTRYSLQVKPGQKVEDQTIVANAGTKALTITMRAADAYNTDAGEFALQDSATAPTDAGSWVTFAGGAKTQQITLAPGKAQVLNFTVTVPANAKPGDHAAGVLASWTIPNGDIQVERRIASRVYVRVAGALQPVLTASNFTATYAPTLNPLDGTVTLSTVITNSGNVALAGTVDVTVKAWWGGKLGATQTVQMDEILPGNSRTVRLQITGVPAAVVVMPKLVLRSSIGGDAQDPGPLPVIQRETNVIAVPWMILAVIALGVVVFFLLRWRRLRNERLAAEWVKHTEAEARKNATAKSSADKEDAR
jgi:hypothetical protein